MSDTDYSDNLMYDSPDIRNHMSVNPDMPSDLFQSAPVSLPALPFPSSAYPAALLRSADRILIRPESPDSN